MFAFRRCLSTVTRLATAVPKRVAPVAPLLSSMPAMPKISLSQLSQLKIVPVSIAQQLNAQFPITQQEPVESPEFFLDSVMRKRKLKMKKHKLRKRRKEQKALRRKQGR